MNNQNKPISSSNLINLVGVMGIFALIGFCCWLGNSAKNNSQQSIIKLTPKSLVSIKV